MQLYYAEVITESSDHYRYLFREEPKSEDLINMIWEWESGEEEDKEFYHDTCSVIIEQMEVI